MYLASERTSRKMTMHSSETCRLTTTPSTATFGCREANSRPRIISTTCGIPDIVDVASSSTSNSTRRDSVVLAAAAVHMRVNCRAEARRVQRLSAAYDEYVSAVGARPAALASSDRSTHLIVAQPHIASLLASLGVDPNA